MKKSDSVLLVMLGSLLTAFGVYSFIETLSSSKDVSQKLDEIKFGVQNTHDNVLAARSTLSSVEGGVIGIRNILVTEVIKNE